MNVEEVYDESLLYPRTITQLLTKAGLLPEEEETSFEEYIRATSPHSIQL